MLYKIFINVLATFGIVDAFVATMFIANGQGTFWTFVWLVYSAIIGGLACWEIVRD